MPYTCPKAEYHKLYKFFLCKDFKKEGVNYNVKDNCFPALCAHQHYCVCVRGVVNLESAKKCYEEHIKLEQ